MPILPLQQFEDDLAAAEADARAIAALRPPSTIVVRFGVMGMIGEFPYKGDSTPGCGSKIVVRTQRGIEIGDMLTTTCQNSGCGKSVSRQEMLEYIDRSGGRQYPFTVNGRAMRVATPEDMKRQSELDDARSAMRDTARAVVRKLNFEIKIVDVEPILSGDRITVYYTGEARIDPRALLAELTSAFAVKIDLRQVGARDEARLVADYERCGQYCCCKNFLKVLKPISMKAAKTQKATLDPLKISGRCGRLMCCLRYEEQTYDELRKNLPRRKSRVGTPEGDGIVLDSQILTQLVLVRLDSGTEVAIPVEELTSPIHETAPPLPPPPAPRMSRDARPRPRPAASTPIAREVPVEVESEPARKKKRRRKRKPTESGAPSGPTTLDTAVPPREPMQQPIADRPETESEGGLEQPRKKKRRRRRRKSPGEGSGPTPDAGPQPDAHD
jgi:cell fate regulator YaaT (PSP1 superfamily)